LKDPGAKSCFTSLPNLVICSLAAETVASSWFASVCVMVITGSGNCPGTVGPAAAVVVVVVRSAVVVVVVRSTVVVVVVTALHIGAVSDLPELPVVCELKCQSCKPQ